MSHLISFNFETSEIRVVEVDNEPWFVLIDVLTVIQTATSRNEVKAVLIENLGEGVVNSFPLQTNGGKQNVLIINESALTFVLSRSRTELGKKMNRWIHIEVLPSIRKDGFYINKGAVQNTDQLTQLIMNMQSQLNDMQNDLQNRNAKLESEKSELQSENSELIKQRNEYQQDQIQLHKVYSQLPGLKAAIESAKRLPDEKLATFTLSEFLDENFPELNIQRGQRINIGRTVSNFCKLAKIQILPKSQNNHTLYDERFAPMIGIATLLELGLIQKCGN